MAAADIDYMDTDGMEDKYAPIEKSATASSTSSSGSKWDGKTYNKNETDWGRYYDKGDYQKDMASNSTTAEEGYGKPSKGKYSMSLGGYKSFGTEGQGNDTTGLKDENATTCSDRIILLTVSAIADTTEDSSSPVVSSVSPTASAHPIVKQSSGNSYLTIEVGNYQFLSDLSLAESITSVTLEESANTLLKALVPASLLALVAFSS